MISKVIIERPNKFLDHYRIGLKVGSTVWACEIEEVKNDVTKMQMALEIVEQFISEDKQREECKKDKIQEDNDVRDVDASELIGA